MHDVDDSSHAAVMHTVLARSVADSNGAAAAVSVAVAVDF